MKKLIPFFNFCGGFNLACFMHNPGKWNFAFAAMGVIVLALDTFSEE